VLCQQGPPLRLLPAAARARGRLHQRDRRARAGRRLGSDAGELPHRRHFATVGHRQWRPGQPADAEPPGRAGLLSAARPYATARNLRRPAQVSARGRLAQPPAMSHLAESDAGGPARTAQPPIAGEPGRNRDMFIQTEQTPNPATLKFLPGREVMARGVVDFTDPAAAADSPLARRLFEVEGVTGVFFGADFITVTKAADQDWYVLKPAVLGAIMEHYMSGDPVMAPEATLEDEGGSDEDDEIVRQIRELIDTRVRP